MIANEQLRQVALMIRLYLNGARSENRVGATLRCNPAQPAGLPIPVMRNGILIGIALYPVPDMGFSLERGMPVPHSGFHVALIRNTTAVGWSDRFTAAPVRVKDVHGQTGQ